MRRLLLFLFAVVLCLPVSAQLLPTRRGIFRVTGGGAAPTYLINQNFEGAGYDNSETWTETANPDEDYTTSPAPLAGSQSLFMTGTTQRDLSPTFTGQDEVWIYFMFNGTTFPASGNATLIQLMGPNVTVDLNTSGTARIGGTVNSAMTTDAMSPSTTYHCRVHYIKDLDGGGGSAVYSFEFSTTSTFTGSGNKFTQATTGTDTAQVTAVRFHCESGTSMTFIFDKVLVDEVEINAP